jgi:hypothetical protein
MKDRLLPNETGASKIWLKPLKINNYPPPAKAGGNLGIMKLSLPRRDAFGILK